MKVTGISLRLPVYLYFYLRAASISSFVLILSTRVLRHRLASSPLRKFPVRETEAPGEEAGLLKRTEQQRASSDARRAPGYPFLAHLGCVYTARTPARLCLCFPRSCEKAHRAARRAELKRARGKWFAGDEKQAWSGGDRSFASASPFRPQEIRNRNRGNRQASTHPEP